jgi:NADH:ubiquinone oxidoreductase subunit 4 (subunit M)
MCISYDNHAYLTLVYIRFFILGIVYIRESSNYLKTYSLILVVICILFFGSSRLIILYITFELSIFPITLIIIRFGYQIEKVIASYYLLIYGFICSIPFLFFYFKYLILHNFVYINLIIRYEIVFLLD